MPSAIRRQALEYNAGVMYRFDRFTLDTRTRRLLCEGEDVHLAPKVFELLLLLVENRACAMSKAELQQRLWPSTYVLETNLAGLVADLRKALLDTADEPRFVRTLHRFGYRFIGAVEEVEDREETSTATVKYWLVWETRQVALSEGENILGRAPDASVWIDAAGVSRHHARIVVSGRDATVEDLGSKNGTYVGARKVSAPQQLADGDQIRLGSVIITFRIPPPVGSTETVSAR